MTAFETGTKEWHRFDRWPINCQTGCVHSTKALYLQPGNKLGFTVPAGGEAFTEYVSDPARPVTTQDLAALDIDVAAITQAGLEVDTDAIDRQKQLVSPVSYFSNEPLAL